jgi:hypothetical protein
VKTIAMNKAHILQEIKRTAEANGGIPLGISKFEQETGIKEGDWFGKFWARWSDAVKEAGLVPNELQTAFNRTDVFDKFAQLACELGRIPVKGDLRLKKRQDSTFPNEKVFDRFGSKSDFIKELASYCKVQKEYENVARFCDEYIAVNQNESEKAVVSEGQIGFVYLIKSGHFYKIGKTNSLGRREYELAIQLPEKSSTIHSIRTDDPNGIEIYWQNRFALKRIRKGAEFFKLSPADIAIFKRRKFM